MDEFVTEADAIKTSGRWVALNNRIRELSQLVSKDDVYKLQALAGIASLTFSNYRSLKALHEENNLDFSKAAWHARNLLELSIWANFCNYDDENIRALYHDVGKNLNEAIAKLIKWGEVAFPDDDTWLNEMKEGKDQIGIKATELGFDAEQKYTDIYDAADKRGLGETYRISNKFLSKFVHQTALTIFAIHDEEMSRRLTDHIFKKGCICFLAAFTLLEIWAKYFNDELASDD